MQIGNEISELGSVDDLRVPWWRLLPISTGKFVTS